MKHFTFNFKWLVMSLLLCIGSSAWGQSDKSATYTSNVTLSTKDGTKATASKIVINSTNYDAMKLGSNGNSGNFKVTFPIGTKYIHLHVAGWNGKNNTLNLSAITNNSYSSPTLPISLTANTGISGSSSTYTFGTANTDSNPNSSNHYKVITLSSALTSATEITISCSERCVIWGVNSEAAVSATALAVKTAPTKVNYKVGETLDLTGLVLDATIGGNHVDVTSGYTSKIGETAVTSGTTVLNTVGAQTLTFTYGGQTTTQVIHVGELKGIEVTTNPTKTTYDEGQTFNPTGMVVTATYGDKETTETTWTETVPLKDGDDDGYTYSPDNELETTDDNITISYTWEEQTKTDDVAITVNAAAAYTVTFNAGTGSCGTASLTEASAKAGVTLPTATIGVTGWSFAGWATASTTNTEVAPTLYAAGATYKPSDNVILYAVYKFLEGTEGEYIRATKLADVKAASKVILVNGGQTLTTDLSDKDALSESESKVTAVDKTVFTLSGNDTDGYVLSGASGSIGASSLPTSNGNFADISISSSNNTWSIVENTNATNTFTFLNKGGTNVGLEYYSTGSKWVVYKSGSPTSSSYYSFKVYLPNFAIAYNSNPAAIVNPTIAFTTAGNKSLYVQDEASYTNAANVTGISKAAVYSSSDPTVATVSDAGVVTALKAGSTTITAKVAAETGVNTEATATYNVTVKDAKTIAGLKAITSSSSVVSFTADLTGAVVTYVKGDHAFIQDASGAVYASCGNLLTAGKEINGAVSGSIKAANAIDEITAIDLSDATVTDGDIPAAQVMTAAELVANKADLEGKLVRITGATVTANLTSGSSSGGKFSDDGKTTEINLYAPDSNIEALKDAEGTFNGFITLYGGSTIRFNIYEQSQISLTKNAPTAQALTFASDAVELDEDTDDYDNFAGQTVNNAKGTVTYSIDSDDDDVVTSINAETGAIVLSGNYGTATIKASAAAKEVTEGGVTTPYTAAEKTYTVTVYPRYTSTFSINGEVSEIRQATHGAEITIPTPGSAGGYLFIGWKAGSGIDAPTDKAPTMVTPPATPTSNVTYYAIYALGTGTPVVEHTSTFTVKQSSAPSSSPFTSDGSNWTWSGVTFMDDTNACIDKTNGSVTFTLPSGGKAKSLTIYKTTNAWAGAAEVELKDASSNSLNTFSLGSNASSTYNFTSTYNQSTYYTLTNTTDKNAWTDKIVFKYETGGVSYSDYRSSIPSTVDATLGTNGYTTFASPYALDLTKENLPAGVEAYKASSVEGTTVTFTEIDQTVPANTGILLKGEASATVNIPVAASGTAVAENAFEVNTAGTTFVGDDDYYYFGLKKNTLTFALFEPSTVAIPANKAYLKVTKVSLEGPGAKSLNVVFDDATGIESLTPALSKGEGAFYDLQGRRVAQPTKGIYIHNGKKVFIK